MYRIIIFVLLLFHLGSGHVLAKQNEGDCAIIESLYDSCLNVKSDESRLTCMVKGLVLAYKIDDGAWISKFKKLHEQDSFRGNDVLVSNMISVAKAFIWVDNAWRKPDSGDIVSSLRNIDGVCRLYDCDEQADEIVLDHLKNLSKVKTAYTYRFVVASMVRYYAEIRCESRASRLFKYLMKHTDEDMLTTSRRSSISDMVLRRDYDAAAKLYISGIKEYEAMEAKSSKMEGSVFVAIGICLVVVIVAIILVAMFGFRRDLKNDKLNNIISKMTAEADALERRITELELSGSQNTKEIESLRKNVERLRKETLDRIGIGRHVYETLEKGLSIPNDIPNADTYLADFYSVFHSDNYNRIVAEYEDLSPRLFTYLILTDMGYEDSKIKDVLCVSQATIRSIRYRLNAKKIN